MKFPKFMKKNSAILVIGMMLFSFSLAGCRDKYEGRLLSSLDDEKVFNDKTGRYKSIPILSNSYLDYDVYGVFLLPLDKDRLEYAIQGPSPRPTQEEKYWGSGMQGNDFVWDTHWTTPKQFKVWWQRMVDINIYNKNISTYDQYTSKNAKPGMAWCESIITIDKPIPDKPGHFLLYFYPDGHVDANISAFNDLIAESPRVKFEDRLKLPVLKEKACLKEISNPYYGLPRPTLMQ